MIEKEADSIAGKTLRARAGAKAEQDMAFYLRRAFADRQDVFIFNDLRLIHDGEVVQIDHLVLHRHGMFIIESKSVSGEIHITPSGQFIRHYGRKKSGMLSPVEQAKRQEQLLRKLLIANKTSLRDRKLLGVLQGGFKHCPIEVRVAISDKGIIKGEKHAPEVRKADLIPGEIEGRIKAHKQGGRLLNLDTTNDDGMYTFTDAELERVRDFLLHQHQPANGGEELAEASIGSVAAGEETQVAGSQAQPRTGEEPVQRPQYLCSKCQSMNLRILHGRYGYYFKCDDCDGNTWIDTQLDGSDRKGRIRKQGREFYLVCQDTGDERLLFVNPG